MFGQFEKNPEHFIAEASRIIAEQKATMIIERMEYDAVTERYGVDIFTANQTGQNFSRAMRMKNHVYEYVVTDSEVETRFVEELDTSSEVVVYAKLPRGFLIPTPVGDYNPDWAISFKEGSVKHIYFVAETKGSMSSMKLREIERTKIECARKFFQEIGRGVAKDRVKYDVEAASGSHRGRARRTVSGRTCSGSVQVADGRGLPLAPLDRIGSARETAQVPPQKRPRSWI